jgi:cyclic pyranopterin phosphate synthase
MEKKFTHLDASGNPSMVDVGGKKPTKWTAKALSIIILNDDILSHFEVEDIQT